MRCPMAGEGIALAAEMYFQAKRESEERRKKNAEAIKSLGSDWMRVAPGTDAAIWRPWSRETGEL